ncbi:unnamed protein product [Rotaria magnacalcarata]|uniref:Reverse transcriptase n=1 Tax=Rotaria magnacalcarata TaxID=392030 RepID=A0A8S2XVL8_9BILA|nr:unnamed protein product [Rotaria magnacalcarata]
MIETTEQLLRDLVNRKLLPGKYFDKLKPNPIDAELPHLYYNPKDHKVGEPLRPIVSGMKSPTQKISAFLDQIIRPIFDKLTPHSLRNSIEFLKHLKKQGTKDQTLLYTFDITDLYTMIPQQESILATLTGQEDTKLLLSEQHNEFRDKILDPQWNKKDKHSIDFNKDIFVHFTYTPSLTRFGAKFHQLWQEIFEETPLGDISVVFAHRLSDNLNNILVHKKPPMSALKNIVEGIEK